LGAIDSVLVGLGGGGIFGFIVGYALKKIVKLLTIVVGSLAAILGGILYWLESRGVLTISVDYGRLTWTLYSALTWASTQSSNAFGAPLQAGPTIAGFAAGVSLGLHRG
jgi:uncharacterized membrane protein (Fun14 family)